MAEPPNILIAVPRTTRETLSICACTEADLSHWVAGLPMANTAKAADRIMTGVREVSELATDAATRLALLEVLRPAVHYLSKRLDQAALKQTQHAEAIGGAAQKLQTQLCMGYKAVVRDALAELPHNRAIVREILPTAIHRAISDLSRQLLRTLQLYVRPPKKTWLELNQLYLLAEKLDLSQFRVRDPENYHDMPLSITDAYLRQVLLSCCKPNQLRYQNLSRIFNALEQWSSRVMIESALDDALFAVDLASDAGPAYASLNRKVHEARGIRTDVLVYELDAYLREIDTSIPIPEFIDSALMQQLAAAWGRMSQRSFRRMPAKGSLMVCIGLRSAHYVLSGGIPFADQISNATNSEAQEINPFLSGEHSPEAHRRKDVWDSAYDPNSADQEEARYVESQRLLSKMAEGAAASARQRAVDDERLGYQETTMLDTSPGGYRVRWHDGLPANLQTGELLAVREASDPRWCVAVVRWIAQSGDDPTTGIELLAPRALPVAARVMQKRGGPTDYTRALLLPEIKPINQAATLLTPCVPFASDLKVNIHHQGAQSTAQLQNRVTGTDSFNQFTFRMLDGYLENPQTDLNIDSLSALIGELVTDASE